MSLPTLVRVDAGPTLGRKLDSIFCRSNVLNGLVDHLHDPVTGRQLSGNSTPQAPPPLQNLQRSLHASSHADAVVKPICQPPLDTEGSHEQMHLTLTGSAVLVGAPLFIDMFLSSLRSAAESGHQLKISAGKHPICEPTPSTAPPR
jgi:hypothetical protein